MADLSVRPNAPATTRLAELHRQCREDYQSSAARRAQNHRDDAHLIAAASTAAKAVSAR